MLAKKGMLDFSCVFVLAHPVDPVRFWRSQTEDHETSEPSNKSYPTAVGPSPRRPIAGVAWWHEALRAMVAPRDAGIGLEEGVRWQTGECAIAARSRSGAIARFSKVGRGAGLVDESPRPCGRKTTRQWTNSQVDVDEPPHGAEVQCLARKTDCRKKAQKEKCYCAGKARHAR